MAAADEKVVEMHLPLLDELIIFDLANCSYHLLANHHADQLISAQPLLPPPSNSIHLPAKPPHPAASTSASVKQVPPPTTDADDQKVSS
jgi:hypothetical protein